MLHRFTDVVASRIVMAAAISSAMGSMSEPSTATKQERPAICAVVVQSVARRHGDDRTRNEAGASVNTAAGARASAPATSSLNSSCSHCHNANLTRTRCDRWAPLNEYGHPDYRLLNEILHASMFKQRVTKTHSSEFTGMRE